MEEINITALQNQSLPINYKYYKIMQLSIDERKFKADGKKGR